MNPERSIATPEMIELKRLQKQREEDEEEKEKSEYQPADWVTPNSQLAVA